MIDSEEFYLVHRARRFEPSATGRTELERRYIHGARWCDADDIAELVAAGEQVYPLQLGELLPAANRLADAAMAGSEAGAGRASAHPMTRLSRQGRQSHIGQCVANALDGALL